MYRFAFLAFLAAVSATVVVDSPCPDVKRVENFDFAAYASGTWYEVGRYPNSAEKDAKCGWAEYILSGDVASVKNFHVLSNKIKVIEGTHRLAEDANKSGKIIVRLPYGENGAITENVLNILAVDYDNYLVGYYCKYDEAKKSRQDFAWIFSRSKTVPEATKTTIDNFVKESKFLDSGKFVYPSFSNEDCKIIV